MFAAGYCLHQDAIRLASVVASFAPLGTSFPSGCLPALLPQSVPHAHVPSARGHHRGSTGTPMLAYRSAAARHGLTGAGGGATGSLSGPFSEASLAATGGA